MNAPDTLENVGEIDRTTYLGSSNAAPVMGLGAYSATPLSVYFAKIGEAEEEMDPKRKLFLERRKRWEGPIVEMLREEFDGNIVAVNRRYRDPEYDFLAAEIDFEWRDQDGSIQNGEIKTCSPFAFGEKDGWGEAGTSDIPVHYACQVMFSLMVTGRQTCVVAAMVGLDNMIFYRVERDEETIASMRERMVSFWRNNVLARVPPDPVSYEDCLRLTLRMRGKPVEIDDKIAASLRLLKELREEAQSNEGAQSEIKFEILNFIRKAWLLEPTAEVADNAVLLSGGIKVASYNAQSTTRLDGARLKEEKPDIAAAYSKTTKTRVLRLAKSK